MQLPEFFADGTLQVQDLAGMVLEVLNLHVDKPFVQLIKHCHSIK